MSKKALCIGINYKGTQNELYGCINDVINVQNYLNKQGYKDITLITDNTSVKPTKVNIVNAMNNLISSLKSGDTGVIWYSGHGTRVKDRNGDEVSGYDSCICPVDFMASGFIVDDDINNYLKKVPANAHLNIVFDSCNSGTACDLKYNYVDTSVCTKSKLPKTFSPSDWSLKQTYVLNNRVSELAGDISLISGCSDNQTSSDTVIGGKPSGALTGYLLQVLNAYPDLAWGDLLSYLNCTLKIYGYSQRPQLSLSKTINIKNKNIYYKKSSSKVIFGTEYNHEKFLKQQKHARKQIRREHHGFIGGILNFIGTI